MNSSRARQIHRPRNIAAHLKAVAQFSFFALGACFLAVPAVHAQQVGEGNAAGGAAAGGAAAGETAPVTAPGIVQVDNAALAGLPTRLAGRVGAISLRANLAALEANPAARDALLNWVKNGGVAFLHTDAAQLFGYTTVAARPGSNRQGGQLYGRSRAALPFGASPLLVENNRPAAAPSVASAANLRAGADVSRLPGVNVVYYEMQEGDDLVVSHASGTPLLTVTDMASNGGRALYASAITGYGAGWAVFTPDYIDQRRAEGALFLRNLLGLVPDARGQRAWLGVRASLIVAATTAGGNPNPLLQELTGGMAGAPPAPALPAFGSGATAPRPPLQGGGAGTASTPAGTAPAAQATSLAALTETRLLLSSGEAAGILQLFAGTDNARKTAILQLLRARLEWQRGDAAQAATWIEAAATAVPDSAEVSLLRGYVTASGAQDISQPSPVRARILADAVGHFDAAAVAPALVRTFMPAEPAPGTGNTGGGVAGGGGAGAGAAAAPAAAGEPVLAVGGVAVTSLRDWSARARKIANMFAAEPPLVQQIGTGDAAIILRHYAEDSSVRIIGPALVALADSRFFGWRADGEEVVLFPTTEYYAAYRRAAGLTSQFVPSTAGGLGDIAGSRILIVAVPSFPRVVRDAAGRVRYLPGESSGANVLARLHSYILWTALAEGNPRPPAWLQLGLEQMVSATIAGTNEVAPARTELYQFARAGGLLAPNQFTNGGGQSTGLAEGQALALLDYFYRTFGPGAVVETLQRLGAGQTTAQALEATTELDEMGFFQSWRDAEFGPQNFPNAG